MMNYIKAFNVAINLAKNVHWNHIYNELYYIRC